jgi:hypothetical protein
MLDQEGPAQTRDFLLESAPGYRLATGYGGLAGFGYAFGYQALPMPFVGLRRPPAGGALPTPLQRGSGGTVPEALTLNMSCQ